MNALPLGAIVCLAVTSVSGQVVRFDNYKVFIVPVGTAEQYEAVSQLDNSLEGISLWNGVRIGRPSDVMVMVSSI